MTVVAQDLAAMDRMRSGMAVRLFEAYLQLATVLPPAYAVQHDNGVSRSSVRAAPCKLPLCAQP